MVILGPDATRQGSFYHNPAPESTDFFIFFGIFAIFINIYTAKKKPGPFFSQNNGAASLSFIALILFYSMSQIITRHKMK